LPPARRSSTTATGGGEVCQSYSARCGSQQYRASIRTTARSRIDVGGSGARCRDCDFCTSEAGSRSSDKPAAGSPVDCSSSPHRCGQPPMSATDLARCWFRHRLRSSLTERRPDTAERSAPGGRRSTLPRNRASALSWLLVEQQPDTHYRNRFFGCASKAVHRKRDTVSWIEATSRHRQTADAKAGAPYRD